MRNLRKNYWQSADLNWMSYINYIDTFIELAVNRYQWINLPKGTDERFLEMTLFTEGSALFFKPEMIDRYYTTKYVSQGPLNVYDNPTRFRSIGNNGWNYDVTTKNGVIIWDNLTRVPLFRKLEMYARRLADIDRTLDTNLKNQKTPYIITGPEEKQNELRNFFKQLDGKDCNLRAT